eukprot:2948896-Pyramimonas_sp.AAC.1
MEAPGDEGVVLTVEFKAKHGCDVDVKGRAVDVKGCDVDVKGCDVDVVRLADTPWPCRLRSTSGVTFRFDVAQAGLLGQNKGSAPRALDRLQRQ